MKLLLAAVVLSIACVSAIPPKPANVYQDAVFPPTSRIIGGVEAERYDFPYMASIRWGMFGVSSHICGGALIQENWVLTAARCKSSTLGSYQVILGMLNQGEDHEDVQRLQVSKFIVHPKYPGNNDNAPYDIGLLKLKTPAKLSKAVKLVPLPEESDCARLGPTILSGWGLTQTWLPVRPDRLHWTQLPRITNEQCAEALKEVSEDPTLLDDTMICTKPEDGHKQSPCSGDDGGPLVQASSGKVVGILSWEITSCATKGAPAVYTNVCSHLDFINVNT